MPIDNDVKRWTRYDSQTVTQAESSGQQRVRHGKSALENLKAAGRNLVDIVDPTNHFRATQKATAGGNHITATLGLAFRILMVPWNLAGEVFDVIAGPIKAAKNVGDAAVHGVMAGIDKVQGRD